MTTGPVASGKMKVYCYNTTSWSVIQSSPNGNYPGMYEEAIYWNITTGTPDVVLPSLHMALTGANTHLKYTF